MREKYRNIKIKKILMQILLIAIVLLTITSCNIDSYPKPRGQVRLEYPQPEYTYFTQKDSIYYFKYSKHSTISNKGENNLNIRYPKMDATIHLTYHSIDSNYYSLIKDIEELTFKHSIRANSIDEKYFQNQEFHTKGILFDIEGEVASNIQFYITDSTENILSGELYFYVEPNYDSLKPAIDYIKNDIVELMESLRWGNNSN
jgi:gliding motility-associated lipoprotein GldD